MENKTLLFEIGTEELPSSSIYEGTLSLKNNLSEEFLKNKIDFEQIKTYGTPRRLVAFINSLNSKQNPSEKLIIGPPEKISFNENGEPTEAALGFAKSLKISVGEIERLSTDKGVYLSKKIFEEGKKTVDILPEILSKVIYSISFSKQMTWANWQIKFARPIRWILALYGDELIKVKIESLTSSNFTFGHRTLHSEKIKIKNAEEYLDLLENVGKVIVDGQERKKIILEKILDLENKYSNDNLKVIINHDLLGEVINLVEIPNVLLGSFPENFLKLPKDILIKAIEYHQRYFAITGKNGDVVSKFIVVQNGIEDKNNEIIKGNERVLKARLQDAFFFYSEDKKHTWEDWVTKLKGVTFFSGLGSMYDKEQRLEKLCEQIINQLIQKATPLPENILGLSKRASYLCKTDLVTNLVVEFPELQGVVGREYAKERGENPEVYEAIFEHYLPRFYGDILPFTQTGTVLSISDKIDTITGMFLTDNIPSGSEDPFALRRKALGVVQSILDKNYDIDFYSLISFSIDLYEAFIKVDEIKKENLKWDIFDFIIARLKYTYEKANKRTDIIDAIVSSQNYSILDIKSRYEAIDKVLKNGLFDDISLPMIRCKNIIKGKNFSSVNKSLFVEKLEKEIYESLIKRQGRIKDYNLKGLYEKSLEELIDFRKEIDTFFEKILIMDKIEEIRNNRINLVKQIADLYLSIADFSKIVS